MNINELLALAIQRAKLKNKTQLAHKIGIAPTHMSKYERGIYIPTDEILCNFCELAEVDPKSWLLWAKIQREEGKAKAHWAEIAALYVKETHSQVA